MPDGARCLSGTFLAIIAYKNNSVRLELQKIGDRGYIFGVRALRRDAETHVRRQHASSPGTSSRGHGRNTFHLSPNAFGAEPAAGGRPSCDGSHHAAAAASPAPVPEPASAAAQAPVAAGSQPGRPQPESTVGAGQGTLTGWTVDKRSDQALNSFVASNRTAVTQRHLAGSRYSLVCLLLG